jgi:L-lactate utilization protein LutB
MCGAAAGDPDSLHPGRRVRLQIGHIIDKTMGGTDDHSNLRALCSNCNEGASNVTMMRPDLKKLMIEVRRATIGDQLEILKWLIQKFPQQTKEYSP